MQRPFTFEAELTLAQNFRKWYEMDTAEREAWGEPRLEWLEGIRRFAELQGVASVAIQDSMEEDGRKWAWSPKNS